MLRTGSTRFSTIIHVCFPLAIVVPLAGCVAMDVDPAIEGSTNQALVWTTSVGAPFSSSSPSVAGDSSADRATGRLRAEARGFFWDDDSHAWVQRGVSMPAFVNSSTISATVQVNGGQVSAVSHPPFGFAEAGVALWMSVTSSDGRSCSREVKLDEIVIIGEARNLEARRHTLSCTLPAVTSGGITVQVGARTWANGFGEGHAEANVDATVISIAATKDSGREDGGDVLITDSTTGGSHQADDLFGSTGDQYTSGRFQFSAVSSPRSVLLSLDRLSGAVTVGSVGSESISPPGGTPFPPGLDVCGPGRVCLVGDVRGRNGTDELLAFDQRDGRVRTFLSNGSTRFTFGAEQDTMGWCGRPFRCQVADVNGDGTADVLRMGNGLVEVALNDGRGTFGFSQPGRPTLPQHSGFCFAGERCTTGRINDDAMADLVSFDASGGTWTALGTETGFGPRRDAGGRPCFPLTGFQSDCQIADVDGDGLSDAVRFFHDDGGLTFISLSDGLGNFAPPFARTTECKGARHCLIAPVRGRPGVTAGRQQGDIVSIEP